MAITTEEAIGRYAAFDIGSRRGVGIIEKVNNCTLLVAPVNLRDSKIARCCNASRQGRSIKRHIEKHNVRIYPAGVIPHPSGKK